MSVVAVADFMHIAIHFDPSRPPTQRPEILGWALCTILTQERGREREPKTKTRDRQRVRDRERVTQRKRERERERARSYGGCAAPADKDFPEARAVACCIY